MEVHLVRHTTPLIDTGICYGQTDLELADTFDQELQDLKPKLPGVFDAIYSSPLKRCLKLVEALENDFVLDDQLKELDFGDWEMRPWDNIPKDELNQWMKDWVSIAPPNGESADQLFQRVSNFIETLKSERLERIMVVSHLGVIRCFQSWAENVSLEEVFMNFKLPYGGVHKVAIH